MTHATPAADAPASSISTPPPPCEVPKFLHPDALWASLHFLRSASLFAHKFPDAPGEEYPDPPLAMLLDHAEHGSTTSVLLNHVNGSPMVGVSLFGRNYRWLHPLDYVAVRLCTGAGLPLTLQSGRGGFDYPRFRAAMPGVKEGWNIYLMRVLTDAKSWQTVTHLTHLSDLGSIRSGANLDHHYLGRDALGLKSVEEVWAEDKKSHVPKLGRAHLIKAALHYFDTNSAKAGFTIGREEYARAIHVAFALADWRHGRADGKPASIIPTPFRAPIVPPPFGA